LRRITVLLFKKKFLPAIMAGEKTQTIRLWKFRKMRPGQRSYIPGVGYIGVLAVDEVAIDDLVDSDAVPDGFPTAAALRAEIRALYGDRMAGGSRAFRIRFRVLEPDEQAAAVSQRNARKSAPGK
jgi:hypothetical protein